MLKIILFGFSLLSGALNVYATEHRFRAIERFGEKVVWDGKKLPLVLENIPAGGNLVIAGAKPVESIAPYTSQIADDLLYESLFTADPSGQTERMYARIAYSVRVDDEGKYVVFEIDPAARFQDGHAVRPADIHFSATVLSAKNPDFYHSVVGNVTEGEREIRFDLKTTGQASRHALIYLAGMKVVKRSQGAVQVVGGIPVEFVATGPYRLNALGKNQISLIRNTTYWASSFPMVNGLYHLNRVELMNFGSLNGARMALAQDNANYFLEPHPLLAAPLASVLDKNKSTNYLEEESAQKIQIKKPALVFNLSKVPDVRVRRALMLAYDFDGINQSLYGGKPQRPLHIAETSEFQPQAIPGREVIEVMEQCPLPREAYDDFTSYGHSQFLGDRRTRLMKAQSLLIEAGYALDNGVMKLNGRGLSIRIHAPDLDANALFLYQSDLRKIGVNLIAGLRSENPKDFDLYASDVEFLSKDGRPMGQNLNVPVSACLRKILSAISNESPYSEAYKINSEAFVRMSEALQLFIFTGSARTKNYFIDHRLQVPSSLTRDNLHVYGYYRDLHETDHSFVHAPAFGHHCQDIGCLFESLRKF